MTSAAGLAFQPAPQSAGPAVSGMVQRCGTTPCDCQAAKEDRTLDRNAVTRDHACGQLVPPQVHQALRSGGQPLAPADRAWLEARLGHDFSGVRIHKDAAAATSARAVSAHAYTVGRDIVFGSNRWAPSTQAGRRLLLHELTHVVQQRTAPTTSNGSLVVGAPTTASEQEAAKNETADEAGAHFHASPAVLQRQPSQERLRELCEPAGNAPPFPPGACTYREPERCVTYEQWIATLGLLRHFTSADTVSDGTPTGHQVLGAAAASTSPGAAETQQPPSPVAPQPADRFIDHPTDQWVRTCLPENLRQTAYRLPTDCADIAVILRHVWLAAHHRTETWAGWIVGDLAGGAAQRRVGAIIGEVYTGNVQGIVNAYTDASGRPLTRFDEVQGLLHPGDVLVWAHHDAGGRRTGGHTHTITEIQRSAGRVVLLRLLQGNQPITEFQATEIRAQLRTEQPRGRIPAESQLRDAPGRRIEVDTLKAEADDLRDRPLPERRRGRTAPSTSATRPIWTWSDGTTTLVAAGPPAAAPRPVARTRRRRAARHLSDWFDAVRTASRGSFQGTFEAALLELRSTIEAGSGQPSDQDVSQLGRIAGERLWSLAKQRQDLGAQSHFEQLERLRNTLVALGGLDPSKRSDNPNAAEVRRVFTLIGDSFELAARGATSVDFPAPAVRGTVVRVLLTGFDPFNPSQPGQPPAHGAWNPSGAAVLALDGARLTTTQGVAVAVEGVVLPVDFTPFDQGLVERIVRPLAGSVDAVITVSMDPEIDPGQPVRLERFAVGVHQLDSGQLRDIPAAGGAAGPAFIETGAPLEQLSLATARSSRRGQATIPAPSIGNSITFEFASPRESDEALLALGLRPQERRQVEIGDPSALHRIGATAARGPGEAELHFEAGGHTHRAKVVRGPGGSYLSNEVSYRVLRLLSERPVEQRPLSFHVHTQRGDEIPPQAGRRERQALLERARSVRTVLIASLTRLIQAVVAHISGTREPSRSQPERRRRGTTR